MWGLISSDVVQRKRHLSRIWPHPVSLYRKVSVLPARYLYNSLAECMRILSLSLPVHMIMMWSLLSSGCRVGILGTKCDQCVCMVQCYFTSTETVRPIRTGSPEWPPRLSHSSWTLSCLYTFVYRLLPVAKDDTSLLFELLVVVGQDIPGHSVTGNVWSQQHCWASETYRDIQWQPGYIWSQQHCWALRPAKTEETVSNRQPQQSPVRSN